MLSYRVLTGFLLVTTTIAGAACTSGRADTSAPQPQQSGRGGPPAIPVDVGHVVRKTMPLDLTVIGAVEPASTVSVHAQITGQLETVGFEEGDEVTRGQVLFTLDRRPLEAALKQAEANLQRDTAQAANARAQAQRLTDLQVRGIATREQLDTSRANAEALEGTLGADRAALDNARIQLQYATITAPISGRTGALMVHAGSLLRANDTTPLVVINQLSPIDVSFAVPEAQLAALKRSLGRGNVAVSVELPDDTGTHAEGRVTFLDNAVDQTTGTIRAKGSLANRDHRLWPGEFVNVTLTLSTDVDAIVVPTAAVQSGQDGSYVFVVTRDQVVEFRPVHVRRISGNETIVADGLQAGDVVVTDGHLRLTAGVRVSVKNESPGAGA